MSLLQQSRTLGIPMNFTLSGPIMRLAFMRGESETVDQMYHQYRAAWHQAQSESINPWHITLDPMVYATMLEEICQPGRAKWEAAAQVISDMRNDGLLVPAIPTDWWVRCIDAALRGHAVVEALCLCVLLVDARVLKPSDCQSYHYRSGQADSAVFAFAAPLSQHRLEQWSPFHTPAAPLHVDTAEARFDTTHPTSFFAQSAAFASVWQTLSPTMAATTMATTVLPLPTRAGRAADGVKQVATVLSQLIVRLMMPDPVTQTSHWQAAVLIFRAGVISGVQFTAPVFEQMIVATSTPRSVAVTLLTMCVPVDEKVTDLDAYLPLPPLDWEWAQFSPHSHLHESPWYCPVSSQLMTLLSTSGSRIFQKLDHLKFVRAPSVESVAFSTGMWSSKVGGAISSHARKGITLAATPQPLSRPIQLMGPSGEVSGRAVASVLRACHQDTKHESGITALHVYVSWQHVWAAQADSTTPLSPMVAQYLLRVALGERHRAHEALFRAGERNKNPPPLGRLYFLSSVLFDIYQSQLRVHGTSVGALVTSDAVALIDVFAWLAARRVPCLPELVALHRVVVRPGAVHTPDHLALLHRAVAMAAVALPPVTSTLLSSVCPESGALLSNSWDTTPQFTASPMYPARKRIIESFWHDLAVAVNRPRGLCLPSPVSPAQTSADWPSPLDLLAQYLVQGNAQHGAILWNVQRFMVCLKRWCRRRLV